MEDWIMQMIKERDEAFIDAVMKDDFKKAKRYCKKYAIPIPEKKDVMKAGIYKAVQACTEISDEVKEIARAKCEALGFDPYLKL